MTMPARRFPPPWTAEITPDYFIVRDANGQALSYISRAQPNRGKTQGSGRSWREIDDAAVDKRPAIRNPKIKRLGPSFDV